MAFVRILSTLVRDKQIGKHVVPIVPDESRTFGMEGMFRQLGIFSQVGQLYRPEDSEQLMFYKEDKKGQILQEGINEAGAFSSWIASGTSYSNHGDPDDPVLHLLLDVRVPAGRRPRLGGRRQPHARVPARRHRRAHDAQRRGPAARGRPLARALLDDPQLRLLRPDLRLRGRGDRARGPAADGRRAGGRLLLPHADERELPAPGDARGRGGGDPARGSTGSRATAKGAVQLLGSGTILREVEAAARAAGGRLRASTADVYSVTSFTELARDGMEAERWSLLHPGEDAREPYVASVLSDAPAVAATDYMRAFAEQIRPYVPGAYTVLGTDGFGRSDWRRSLREFFEVDRRYVALAALRSRRAGRRRPRRSPSTRSTRTRRPHGGGEGGRGPRHRGLRRRTGDRGAGLRGRHRRRGGPARHARVRQGHDGRARAVRRRRAGAPGHRRRQGRARARCCCSIEVGAGENGAAAASDTPSPDRDVRGARRRRARSTPPSRPRPRPRPRTRRSRRRARRPRAPRRPTTRRRPTPARPCAGSRARRAIDLSHGRGLRPQGPDHQGGPRAQAVRRRPRPRRRRRPSRASAPSASSSRGSRSSPARTWSRAGRRSRTSPSTTRPTSPTSRRSARSVNASQKDVKVTMVALLVKACVTLAAGVPGGQRVARRRRRT